MERVWIELNRNGIAVQPYYVIPDQLERLKNASVPIPLRNQVEDINSNISRLFELKNGALFMILRVGWPIADPVRSSRLPINRVLSVGPDTDR